MMRTVDTRGQLCPAPLIAAKRTLREVRDGETFKILTDNKTSYSNLMRFLRDNKAGVLSEAHGEEWTITVSKNKTEASDLRPEDYCSPEITHFEKGDFTVVISSDKMGEGDDELGHLLIGNFIKALKDLDKLPGKIILYNKGVTLAATGNMHVEHLRDLEKMGVDIILCSTCVNYYKLEGRMGAGTVSDMFTIAGLMASASKIIKP